MKKLLALSLCMVFALSVSAFSLKSPPKTGKVSSKEAVAKQKAKKVKGGKFTKDMNKVKETRILQGIKRENTLKKGSTPPAPAPGEDIHPSEQF